MAIYLTSDLHLFHNREFLYQPRGFNSTQEMSDMIVKNWNSIVNPEDEVYVLGDLMLNDNIKGIEYLKQLKGNIHIILGNHDTNERIKLYNECPNVVEVCWAVLLHYEGYKFYLSHYPVLTSNYDEGKPLSHMIISLCGHCHIKDKFADMDKGLIYHVELDAHNNTPVLIDDIITDIKEYLHES